MNTRNLQQATLSVVDVCKQALVCSLIVIGGVLVASSALAKGPDKGGGKGGGDETSAYTIIDLPGPYHDTNAGSSQTTALRIADAVGTDTIHVLGAYGNTFNQPCVWTIESDGSIVVNDLVNSIDMANDVNSAGVIAGQQGNRPMLLLADGTPVFLSDQSVSGAVLGLNNPDASGVFQAVGFVGPWPGVMWDVDLTGNILSEVILRDANGWYLSADDISDSQFLGGSVYSTPSVGAFDEDGQLQIDLLSLPSGIDGVRDYQIDDAGNLLGFGYQSAEGFGYYARAAIWPAGGGAINLTALTGVADTEGNGIAFVDGTMQVVGRAHDSRGESFAYLYANGALSELDALSQGDQPWTLQRAEGINTSGMICGQGRVGSKRNFEVHGYLLIPNTP